MSYKVISIETELEKRRKVTSEQQLPYMFAGEMRHVPKKLNNGQMEVYELTRPIGEMIVTPAGLEAVVQNTVLELEVGREEVPLLYGPIYRTIENSRFTRNVNVAPFINAQCVFLQHMEIEQVKMGTKVMGPGDTVPIITWATGFQITEDMKEYDTTWEVTEMNRSMGEAYNALLNHLHFLPILAAAYPAANTTAAVVVAGAPRAVSIRATIRQALIDAAQDRNPVTRRVRKPNILLAPSADRQDIEDALQRMHVNGTEFPALSGIDTLIFYDGWTSQVGERTYNYPGVGALTAYAIDGKTYFRELIKHDLRVSADNADITRLIEEAVVGRCRRGVLAYPLLGVQQITLPV